MITSGLNRAAGRLDTREFTLKMLIIGFAFAAVLTGNIFLYQSDTNADGINTTLVKDSSTTDQTANRDLIL